MLRPVMESIYAWTKFRGMVPLAILFLIVNESAAILVDMDPYRDIIVDMHNNYRKKVSAADMKEMEWCPRLSDKAAFWSKWCTYERHNHKHHAKFGENLYTVRESNFERVIFDGLKQWYNQGQNYSYGPFKRRCGDTCEYTQLMWSNTNKVGCAINKCGRLFNGYETLHNAALLVCFYEPRGNLDGDRPYVRGIPCASCPRDTGCRDGLCTGNPYREMNIPNTIPVGHEGRRGDREDVIDSREDEGPQSDGGWSDNPNYRYAEGRPIEYATAPEVHRRYYEDRRRQYYDQQRRYPDDMRYRRTLDPRYYTDKRYSYRDEYNRLCSCDCRRNPYPTNPPPRQPARPTPEQPVRPPPRQPTRRYPEPLRHYDGELSQAERYELISVHNLMREERRLPRIKWSAELEKWTDYIVRCDEEYPGPRTTASNFGKMTKNEDVYTFVHAWGSEGGQVSSQRTHRHCRATHDGYYCNRHTNLMKREVREFACSTRRCRQHRQIVCLYR